MLVNRERLPMIAKKIRQSLALICLTVAISSCSGSDEDAGRAINFTNASFSVTLTEAQITSQFAEIYNFVLPSLTTDQLTEKTLFAPSNNALEVFFSENSETLEGVLVKPDVARQLVLIHLLEQEMSASSLLNMNGETLTMLNGSSFIVDSSDGSVQFVQESGKNSKIIAIDLASTDGVVHIIDRVLQP
jgi:uncharacterized surface protein with fasciclin (FAS1) repeats